MYRSKRREEEAIPRGILPHHEDEVVDVAFLLGWSHRLLVDGAPGDVPGSVGPLDDSSAESDRVLE